MQVSTKNNPTVVIELSIEEAIGLNTLLGSGTTVGLDEVLKIDGLQTLLMQELSTHTGKLTYGHLEKKLYLIDLIQ